MDEVVISIHSWKYWLWRAIDADGDVLAIVVQTRRSAKTAKRSFKRLVAQFGELSVVITHKLRSYPKPIKARAPQVEHRTHKGLNNAFEVSHRQPENGRSYLAGSNPITRPKGFYRPTTR